MDPAKSGVEGKLIPLRMTKVTKGDGTPIVYLPREVRRFVKFEVGEDILLLADPAHERIVIQFRPLDHASC